MRRRRDPIPDAATKPARARAAPKRPKAPDGVARTEAAAVTARRDGQPPSHLEIATGTYPPEMKAYMDAGLAASFGENEWTVAARVLKRRRKADAERQRRFRQRRAKQGTPG